MMDIARLVREVKKDIGYPDISVSGLLRTMEHSLLTVDLDEKTVIDACEKAKKYHIAAVCLPPYYISTARKLLSGTAVGVCASIGVPNALISSDAKYADAKYCLSSGADELDVCINSHAIKSGRMEDAYKELSDIVRIAKGNAIVKAAIEMSLFSEEETIAALNMIKESGAAFVKIQNVSSGKPAMAADINYVKKILGSDVRIKIDGGVKTVEKAMALIGAGAARIGLTATFKIAEENEER